MDLNEFKPIQFEDLTAGGSSQGTVSSFDPDDVSDDDPRLSALDDLALAFTPQRFVAEDHATIKKDFSTFQTTEFIAESTLLTNVEEYSKRIKEDADLYAQKTRDEASLILSQAQEELAQTRIIRANAEEEGTALIQAAENSAAEIHAKATEKGFQAGMEAGIKQYREENQTNTRNLLSLMEEIRDMRMLVAREYEQQLVNLAMLLAQKVVHNELKTSPELVQKMLEKLLGEFEGMGKVRITVNPVELEFLKKHQDRLAGFLEEDQPMVLKADPKVAPAHAKIQTSFAQVDMDLNRQFDHLREQLQLCIEERRILFNPPPK